MSKNLLIEKIQIFHAHLMSMYENTKGKEKKAIEKAIILLEGEFRNQISFGKCCDDCGGYSGLYEVFEGWITCFSCKRSTEFEKIHDL
jgi:hypothetical protein